MVACHPCVVVGPSKRCTVPTSSGVVGPSQQCTVAVFAASTKSPAFSLWRPWPRIFLVAAIADAGGDGEVQRPAGVHCRGGQEHGVHGEPSVLSRQRAAPCTAEGPPTDAILGPSSVSAISGTCGYRVHRARRHLAPSWCTVGGSDRAPLHPAPDGLPPEVLRDKKRVVVSFAPAVIRTLAALATRPAAGR